MVGLEMDTSSFEISRVHGLLFDVDGTLSDTDDHIVDRVSKVLLPLSWLFKSKDPRQFVRWFVMAVETPANFLYALMDRIGIDAHLAKCYDWLSKKRRPAKNGPDRLQIIPGVKEMLEKLHGHFPMAVVSARDAVSTVDFLEHFGLMTYFETIVTAHTCEHTKPFPDPVIYAAEQLGLDAQACVMIGDTTVDIRAGNKAGAQTLAVLCGFGTQRELRRAGADLILSRTPDIVNILLNNP